MCQGSHIFSTPFKLYCFLYIIHQQQKGYHDLLQVEQQILRSDETRYTVDLHCVKRLIFGHGVVPFTLDVKVAAVGVNQIMTGVTLENYRQDLILLKITQK